MVSPSIEQFLSTIDSQSVAPATRKALRSDLHQFVTWWELTCGRVFDPAQCVDRDLRAWQVARQQDDGAKPSTINRALSSLRRYCAWAVDQGLMPDNPTRDVADVPTDPPPPRAIPDDAVDALLRAVRTEPDARLRARDEALLALLVYAGLRAQEVCDIQLRDLDLRGATITVRSGKGRKARRVPLHPDAQRLIQRYLDSVRCPSGLPAVGDVTEREPLLVAIQITEPGQPLRPGMSTGLVRHRLHLIGQRAAATARTTAAREQDLLRAARWQTLAQILDDVSPHMLRHSLARRLLKKGAQLPEVQRILGHSRLSTTGIYLTPSDDDLREAIARASV
jgi:site-specific recombinase XerD